MEFAGIKKLGTSQDTQIMRLFVRALIEFSQAQIRQKPFCTACIPHTA